MEIESSQQEQAKIILAVEQLCSMFELAFDGLGCGSERLSDIGRLTRINLKLMQSHIYFTVVHYKKANHQNQLPKKVDHKLPKIIS